MDRLAAAPRQTLAFLRQRLPKSPAEPESGQLAGLIAALDSDQFAERQKAAEKLEELGVVAVPALRKALDARPALEMRQRLQELLETESTLTAEELRWLRTIQVLELMDRAESQPAPGGACQGRAVHPAASDGNCSPDSAWPGSRAAIPETNAGLPAKEYVPMNRATLPCMSVLFLSLAPAFVQAEPLLDEQAMSARIDQLLSDRWADKRIKPAARADDAEFFRRLSLDLNGCIPSITLLKDFLDDTRPNKRQIWVNKLMDGRDPDFKKVDKRLPDLYANHFTNFWRTVIFAQISNRELANLAFNLDTWLRRALKENRPYDRMVVEFLTGQGQPFFQANDNKPEYIAGNAARLFLGVKLECAQCHEDRSGPDGKGYWTHNQFWQYAAFFKGGQPLPPKIDIPGRPARDRGPVPRRPEARLEERRQSPRACWPDG